MYIYTHFVSVISSLNGCLYAGGHSNVSLRSVEKYDSVKDEWITGEDMKIKRNFAGKNLLNQIIQ